MCTHGTAEATGLSVKHRTCHCRGHRIAKPGRWQAKGTGQRPPQACPLLDHTCSVIEAGTPGSSRTVFGLAASPRRRTSESRGGPRAGLQSSSDPITASGLEAGTWHRTLGVGEIKQGSPPAPSPAQPCCTLLGCDPRVLENPGLELGENAYASPGEVPQSPGPLAAQATGVLFPLVCGCIHPIPGPCSLCLVSGTPPW